MMPKGGGGVGQRFSLFSGMTEDMEAQKNNHHICRV
jgi:hypothetical protein